MFDKRECLLGTRSFITSNAAPLRSSAAPEPCGAVYPVSTQPTAVAGLGRGKDDGAGIRRRKLSITGSEHRLELRVLNADDGYRSVSTQQIGRLGVNAEHYPLIFPVNYALDEAGVIVIRTNAGTKLTAADQQTSRSRLITSISRHVVAGPCSCVAWPKK